jgi:hypothetical protein
VAGLLREGFTWTCPAGHAVSATYAPADLEQLRDDLTRRDVEIHCLRCGKAYHVVDPTVLDHIGVWLDHIERTRKRRG